jgi:hypothetical protein
MLYLPAKAGDFFTEAYFVLRDGIAPEGECDLLSRAEEIAAAVLLPSPPKKKRRFPRLLFLLVGASVGSAVTALLFLFL